MVRPSPKFVEVARRYVPVRVTDMREVDLSRYRFDFDLTVAVLLAHPDGTLYHRYGGRPNDGALAWMSLDSLIRVMVDTLDEHREYSKDPAPPKLAPKRTIADIPPFAAKLEQQKVDCVHCHMVHEAERSEAQLRGAWSKADIWVWPAPDRLGLELDPDDQALVRDVAADSSAHAAGLRAGDRLARLGTERVRTIHDVQWVLENTDGGATTLPVIWRRRLPDGEGEGQGEGELHATLHLPAGWNATSARAYAWRPYKWGLDPGPGFGGRDLTGEQKRALGLDPAAFAFEVSYLITWGEKAHTGRNAARAGIRKGDVIFSAGGRRDLASEAHFQAWTRLAHEPGEKIEVRLLRNGREHTVALPLID